MELGSLIGDLAPQDDPDLLVGFEGSDDAGVYRLRPDLALVQTVDFITPVTDDPFAFGQVAAANALSDVYAMGGRPVTALNICCFPARGVPEEVYRQILLGSLDKVHEAGAVLAGGHTVTDSELKYGLSVTGLIDPSKVMTNAAARPGERVILTKPLGTGIAIGAYRKEKASPGSFATALQSMKSLNGPAAGAAQAHGVRACTDVTGFGLAGHALEMARASGCGLRLHWAELPLLPDTLDHIGQGIGTAMAKSNREMVGESITFDEPLQEELRAVLFDPQTSGGLLLSVEEREAESLLEALHRQELPEARIIGEVFASEQAAIRVMR